jgi:hypothetical protein
MGGPRGRGGPGPGYGRQYRGGSPADRGLVGRLGLTEEQAALIRQQDPDFQQQSELLKNRLTEAHNNLVTSLEKVQSDDGELLGRIEDLIKAHGNLEKRVAQHLVLLRPHLSQEQRARLSELCTGE